MELLQLLTFLSQEQHRSSAEMPGEGLQISEASQAITPLGINIIKMQHFIFPPSAPPHVILILLNARAGGKHQQECTYVNETASEFWRALMRHGLAEGIV